jgi:hypothetical protein
MAVHDAIIGWLEINKSLRDVALHQRSIKSILETYSIRKGF